MVPGAGNPQALNRYAYAVGNPVRYNDPSGHLTEDQIKAYFGVETWEEVLSFFETGGELEGRWGWLETLRRAKLGDEILFFEVSDGLLNSIVFQGILADLEKQLYIQAEGVAVSGIKAGGLGDAYGIVQVYGDECMVYLSTLYAEQRYYHLKIDPSKVDWIGAGLDFAEIIADAVSFGVAGKIPDVMKIARTAGKAVDLSAIAWSWPPFAIGIVTGQSSKDECLGLGLDFADLLSPVPCVFDVVGLSVNLSKGIYRTP